MNAKRSQNDFMSKSSDQQSELGMKVPVVEPKKAQETELDYWALRLKPKKTFGALVSNGVMVTQPELEIIDTPDFQRLRRIHQLGTACTVYPTALHTRFDHALGTLDMAEQMIQCIQRNQHSEPDQKNITKRQHAMARIYALIHDITHIPFGHTIEDELGIVVQHDENKKRIEHFLGLQSKVGRMIVKWFDEKFYQDLMRVFRWDGNIANWDGPVDDIFIHDLVSNTVCADFLDYLRRDDHFCNLGVGMSYPFLNYLYLGEETKSFRAKETGEEKTIKVRRVVVRLWKGKDQPRRDVLSDLCRLLEARYLVAERVYFHHAKVIAGSMLGRAIQEAQDSGAITEEAVWKHSDDTLVHELMALSSKAPLAAKLASAYWNRTLYKCALEYRKEDIEMTQAGGYRANWMRDHISPKLGNALQRRNFENHVADLLGVSPGDVLIYFPDRRMNLKQAEMQVLWKGRKIPFREIDDPVAHPRLQAVLEAHERLWSLRVLVAPTLTEEQRNELKEICEVELFTPADDYPRRREEFNERIIWCEIEKKSPATRLSATEVRQKVKQAAKMLCLPAKDRSESFRQRVERTIVELFS
jgi:hypothetical protein